MAVTAPSTFGRAAQPAHKLVVKANRNRAREEERRSTPRILHLSTSDAGGCAGRGASRLHQSLRDSGEDSAMFLLNQETDGPDIFRYRPKADLVRRVSRMMRQGYLDLSQRPYQRTRPNGSDFSDDRSPYGRELRDQLPAADIINLHSVADFLDYEQVIPTLADTPLVWTIHDMNPFTGGCHYDLGCGRYNDACGCCPQLGSEHQNDLSHQVHQRKKRVLECLHPDRVRIVAVSRWLASAARKSPLFNNFGVSHISHGLDPEAIYPRNRAALRASLDIPASAFVVLCNLTDTTNPRRGTNLLKAALRQLARSHEIVLLSVGSDSRPIDGPFRHVHLGEFTTNEMLSTFYSAGDCFVDPSLQEAFDLPSLEAMACGTPVVSFGSEQTSDTVRPGETGRLARSGDVNDLTRELQWMIEHPERATEMGAKARCLVEHEFSAKNQAKRYADLYQELLEVTL